MEYIIKSPSDLINKALKVMESQAASKRGKELFTSPKAVKRYFRLRLGQYECEYFSIAFLDNQNRLIACEDLFRGTIDGASVYPREVVKAVLQYNAAAVILAHNHPSGVVEPSKADHSITQCLRDALKLIEVKVLDHIIVGSKDTYSFAEKGYL
ncbi:MAG TPA: DNA repair protein RadC [Cellvibrionaceae bacterium]|nr:DNA repair protein RadC [Cellvibrionaceae bacterium]